MRSSSVTGKVLSRIIVAGVFLLSTNALFAHTAEINVSITADPAEVPVRETVTYTINVNNGGPDEALGVIIIDDVPSSLTIVNVTTTSGLRCNRSGQRVSCTADSLRLGGPAEVITIVATVPASPGSVTNAVTIQAIGSIDPNPNNNSASVTTPIVIPTVCPDERPQLVTPAAGATDLVSPVQLTWTPVQGAVRYIVRVAQDGGPFLVAAETAQTTASVNVQGAAAQWNVEAIRSSCPSTTSSTRTFSLRTAEPLSIRTLAGQAGLQGTADGPPDAARFNDPRGLAIDLDATLYVADRLSHTIRAIDPSGVVSTLAGIAGSPGAMNGPRGMATLNLPSDVALGVAGALIIADTGNHVIRRLSQDGVVSSVAGQAGTAGFGDGPAGEALFSSPSGVAVDEGGRIYVADTGNHVVRRIDLDGTVTTLAGSAGGPGAADGTGSTARFRSPIGLAFHGGQLFVADTGNHLIRRVSPAGAVQTLAGVAGMPGAADGAALAASFRQPEDVAVDLEGNVYVADTGNHVVRVLSTAGSVSTVAGSTGVPGTADGTGPTAQLNTPRGIVVSPSGHVFIADSSSHTIRTTAPPAQSRRRPARR